MYALALVPLESSPCPLKKPDGHPNALTVFLKIWEHPNWIASFGFPPSPKKRPSLDRPQGLFGDGRAKLPASLKGPVVSSMNFT